MSISVARPVQTLREHSTNFEAALSVCLARPKVRAVHKLRTESRRLEAQIALLRSMKGLPPFRTEAAKALLQVKKMRQAAGRVRDVDVQSEHLHDHAKKVRTGSLSEGEKQALLHDIEAMLAKREQRRISAVAKLTAEITARQQKVAVALEKLNSALKHALQHSLASEALLTLTQQQFHKTHSLSLRRPSADDFHTIRKAAKQARYLTENAGSKTAIAAAKQYEHLQELGGAWHDWLDLTTAARKELGKKHSATADFRELRDHNFARFRTELDTYKTPAAEPVKSPRKRTKQTARASRGGK